MSNNLKSMYGDTRLVWPDPYSHAGPYYLQYAMRDHDKTTVTLYVHGPTTAGWCIYALYDGNIIIQLHL